MARNANRLMTRLLRRLRDLPHTIQIVLAINWLPCRLGILHSDSEQTMP